MTKDEYRRLYPNAMMVCPECDEAVIADGVCFYCVCGCEYCEGDITDQDFDRVLNRPGINASSL